MNARLIRRVLFSLLIAGVLLAFVAALFRPAASTSTIPLSEVIGEAQLGNVDRIDVAGDTIRVRFRDGRPPARAVVDEPPLIEDVLRQNGVSAGVTVVRDPD